MTVRIRCICQQGKPDSQVKWITERHWDGEGYRCPNPRCMELLTWDRRPRQRLWILWEHPIAVHIPWSGLVRAPEPSETLEAPTLDCHWQMLVPGDGNRPRCVRALPAAFPKCRVVGSKLIELCEGFEPRLLLLRRHTVRVIPERVEVKRKPYKGLLARCVL